MQSWNLQEQWGWARGDGGKAGGRRSKPEMPLGGLLCWLLCKEGWRKERQPTPVFLPGESHGPRSLAGYSPSVERQKHAIFSYPFFIMLLIIMAQWSPWVSGIRTHCLCIVLFLICLNVSSPNHSTSLWEDPFISRPLCVYSGIDLLGGWSYLCQRTGGKTPSPVSSW